MSNIDCPVDFVPVNENRVRVVAFFVLVLAVLYIISGSWVIAFLLVADFVLRAINLGTYSPLNNISGELVKLLKLKNKPVDRAPKRFAAFTGLIFSVSLLLSSLFNLITPAKIIAGILIVFASLESFIGFCAGCYVYSLLKKFKILM